METGINSAGAASLHAGLIRREGSAHLRRLKPRAFGRKNVPAGRARALAPFHALLGTPNARLFITTYASTFAFVLGMSG
jgi:hypothetical protein